jgi:rhodanese-related sulfurtransferase
VARRSHKMNDTEIVFIQGEDLKERFEEVATDIRDAGSYTLSAPQQTFFDPKPTETIQFYLATKGKSVIAARSACRTKFGNLPNTYRRGVVEIGLVYTDDPGKGIGRLLFEQLKASVPESTTDLVVYMQSCVQSEAALRFYNKLGFKKVDKVEDIPDADKHTPINEALIERVNNSTDCSELPKLVLVYNIRQPSISAPPKRRISLTQAGDKQAKTNSGLPFLGLSLNDLGDSVYQLTRSARVLSVTNGL